MRKLKSKQEEKKRQKQNQWIVGAILIFVMFGSVFGIVANSFGKQEDKNKINYNGFKFINQNGFWFTTIGNFDFVFKYNPKETTKINSELKSLSNYNSKPLYISSEDYSSKTEIYRNFKQIAERMQDACFKECDEDLPVKTCEDNFIIIRESNSTNITQQNNCVFIEGKKENLTELTDEFLFKVIGIEQ